MTFQYVKIKCDCNKVLCVDVVIQLEEMASGTWGEIKCTKCAARLNEKIISVYNRLKK